MTREQLKALALLSGHSVGCSSLETDLPELGASGREMGKTELPQICSQIFAQDKMRKLTHLVSIKGGCSVQGVLHKVQASRRRRGLPPGRGILCSRARRSEASSAASKLGRLQQDHQLHEWPSVTLCLHTAAFSRAVQQPAGRG